MLLSDPSKNCNLLCKTCRILASFGDHSSAIRQQIVFHKVIYILTCQTEHQLAKAVEVRLYHSSLRIPIHQQPSMEHFQMVVLCDGNLLHSQFRGRLWHLNLIQSAPGTLFCEYQRWQNLHFCLSVPIWNMPSKSRSKVSVQGFFVIITLAINHNRVTLIGNVVHKNQLGVF